MSTDLTTTATDADVDLTVQVVKDLATGRIAIGLASDAASALLDLLDMVDTQAHDLADNYGIGTHDATMISDVAAAVKAGLRKQLLGY